MRAAIYLAQGCSIKESAEKAGCSEKSVDRWLKDEDFRETKLALEKKFHDEEIKAYMLGLKNTGDQYFRIAQTLLDKIEEWANEIDFDSMTHNNILKTITETRAILDASIEGKDLSLGIHALRQRYLEEANG